MTVGDRLSRLRAVGLLALILAAATVPGLAQLSPGPLSLAHQDLDSLLRCTQCHVFGAGQPVFVCDDCHTEIAESVAANRGYHSSVVDPSEEGRDCAACHRDHVGREFELIHWPGGREAFDHGETGYPLAGLHAEQECADCHNAKFIDRQVLATLKVQDPARTFFGLKTACLTCHTDEHQGQLGKDCERCHVQETWEDVEKFDHQQTDFALTGRHETIECVECHTREGGFAKYKGFAFSKCSTCHEDPHEGSFPYQACDNCHSTFNWKPGPKLSNFDHAKTSFPLSGKHAAVSCLDCHENVGFSEPLPHERCLECHEDAHDNQFSKRDDGGDCRACHNEDGFTPTTFTRDDHAETDYPLTGKHSELKCEQCHEPLKEETRYRLPYETCLECHEDEHDGEFSAARYENRCEECHSVDGFHPTSFTITRHQETRFELAGAHLAVSCAACHQPGTGERAEAHSVFHFDTLGCPECHEHPHGEQFAGMASADRLSCESCHDLSSWERLRPFRHDETDFPLLGVHRTVRCAECHQRDDGIPGFEGVAFTAAPAECSGCHEDVHDGQFDQGSRPYPCSTCHTNDDWKPTKFDHNEYSIFTLDGAHDDVPCKMCHTRVEEVDGLPVRIYRGIGDRCRDCHDDQ